MSDTVYRNLRRLFIWLAIFPGCGTIEPVSQFPDGSGAVLSATVFADDLDAATAALPFMEDELLVQSFPGADPDAISALIAATGAEVVETLAEIDLMVLSVPVGSRDGVAASLAASGLFEAVHKNYIFESQATPDDPYFAFQPHLEQIGAPTAWDSSTGAAEIVIAIVDSGVDVSHPDLVDQLIGGWNVYDGTADFDDVFGHGTQAAGVAAAAGDNGVGVAGVAWNSPMLAVRATDTQGRSTARHLAAGILWAAANGAKVINVSFAPLWSNTVVQSAATQAYNRGALVFISAGNGGGSTTAGGYDEAVFVGAVTAADALASFSDKGAFVDLTAPGTSIRTTTFNGAYGLANGTSFASPMVAGVAALAWSVNPDLRPASIVDALLGSAVDLGLAGRDNSFGHGRVDAAAAVTIAMNSADSPDVTSPSLSVSQPSANALLSGVASVVVSASDAGGVADVVLAVDGRPFATDTRAPYRFAIDTATFSPGQHTLTAVATDQAGNVSAERSVAVRFAAASTSTGPGQVTFRSPSDGAVVRGNVSVSAAVSATNGLATLEWFVDGESVLVSTASGTSTGASYVWRSAAWSPGAHTITLVATDSRGAQITGTLRLTLR